MNILTIQEKKIWYEKFDCFSIFGKDNRRFLNGITTGDIINLHNQVLKTCWLSPNGVLKALLEIKCLENKLDIVILAGNTGEIKKYFYDIIFPSDDVSLGETFLISRFQEVDDSNSWRINQPIFFRNLDKENDFYYKKEQFMDNDDLQLWKIKQAIPSINKEINGKNNPLELGLTDLVDFKKGCFLGQETMSKIRNVSSLKQEIRVWNSQNYFLNLESKNMIIFNNYKKEKSVGFISSFLKVNSQKVVGLAIIKRKYLYNENSFFSENFGNITTTKSLGSEFL